MNGINKINLSEQANFQLSEIIGIENYFYQEVNQRKSCSKKIGKCVAVFDCIDQAFIALSATSDGVSIISFTSIVGAPVRIPSASCTLIFSLTTVIFKKITEYNKKQKEKA